MLAAPRLAAEGAFVIRAVTAALDGSPGDVGLHQGQEEVTIAECLGGTEVGARDERPLFANRDAERTAAAFDLDFVEEAESPQASLELGELRLIETSGQLAGKN